jgi:hypothetical protein
MTHNFPLRQEWNGINVILMVVGFFIFWPLGLAMIAYILWGDRIKSMFNQAKGQMNSSTSSRNCRGRGKNKYRPTGNVAFDEYREDKLRHLEEEQKRINQMQTDFDDFLYNLRKARDQEEFDRFMNNRDNSEPKPENGDFNRND